MLVELKPFILSQKALDFLSDNGYKFQSKNQAISFSKPRDMTWLILLAGFIGIIELIINIRSIPTGVLICGVLGVITYAIIRSVKRKPFFMIDFMNKKATYVLSKDEVFDLIGKVSGINTQSQFTGNYTSAMKETNEEYSIAINLKMGKSEQLALFRFKADYQHPDEVKEIVSKLKEALIQLHPGVASRAVGA